MDNEFKSHYVLADLLMDLEMVLREAKLWQCEHPDESALQSVEPFCIDTMSFSQWLRFVMVERFKGLIATGAPLPKRCQVAPMAADAFHHCSAAQVDKIVAVLNRIDAHLSAH